MTAFIKSERTTWGIFVSPKAVLAIIFWGASFVITRIALEAIHPVGLVLARLVLAAAMLTLIIHLHGLRLIPQRDDRTICIVLGLILGVHLSLQAVGLRYTSAINSGWIIGFIPVTIAVAAHLLRKQHITARGWLGTLIGAGGVALVTLQSPPDFTQARWGDALQMSSCLTWTAYTILGGDPVRKNGAVCVTNFAMLVAILVLVPIQLIFPPLEHTLTLRAFIAAAFLGICCSAMAVLWWNEAVSKHGPARVGSLLYFQPFVTLATSVWLLKDEAITWNALAGGTCVLLGVWLIAHGTIRQRA